MKAREPKQRDLCFCFIIILYSDTQRVQRFKEFLFRVFMRIFDHPLLQEMVFICYFLDCVIPVILDRKVQFALICSSSKNCQISSILVE